MYRNASQLNCFKASNLNNSTFIYVRSKYFYQYLWIENRSDHQNQKEDKNEVSVRNFALFEFSRTVVAGECGEM